MILEHQQVGSASLSLGVHGGGGMRIYDRTFLKGGTISLVVFQTCRKKEIKKKYNFKNK